MTVSPETLVHERTTHFDRLQRALEDGLRAINAARSPEEAETARQRARARLAELNQIYEETCCQQ